jgi:hypothetical protein
MITLTQIIMIVVKILSNGRISGHCDFANRCAPGEAATAYQSMRFAANAIPDSPFGRDVYHAISKSSISFTWNLPLSGGI